MGSVCRIAALYTVATNDFESDPRLATEYVPGGFTPFKTMSENSRSYFQLIQRQDN